MWSQASLQLGSKLLKGLGVMSDDVTFLSQLTRDSMELQAQEKLDRTDEQDIDIMKTMQVSSRASQDFMFIYVEQLLVWLRDNWLAWYTQVTSSSVIRENHPDSLEQSIGAISKKNQVRANQTEQGVDISQSKISEQCEKGVTYCEMDTLGDSSNDNGDSFGERTTFSSNGTAQNKW